MLFLYLPRDKGGTKEDIVADKGPTGVLARGSIIIEKSFKLKRISGGEKKATGGAAFKVP